MAGTKEIKRRIKSVKNTKKITKAMELVAASKMKRAVAQALSSRAYATYALELLNSLSGTIATSDVKHSFFMENPSKNGENKTLIVLITSNRGLCGAYNSQVIKKTLAKLKETSVPRSDLGTNINSSKADFITIGKKGDIAMRRIGQDIIATFADLPNNITLRDIVPISKLIADEYKSGKYNKVYVVYTDFKSALSQVANMRKLLPISKEDIQDMLPPPRLSGTPPQAGGEVHPRLIEEGAGGGDSKNSYTFEGNPETLLNMLAEKLVRMQIYQMVIESNASEQSSRMVAMKNASEAAGEMIDDLTLVFNKARQASITQEISEISGGMAASVS